MRQALKECREAASICFTCDRAIREEDNSPLSELRTIVDKAVEDAMNSTFPPGERTIVRVCEGVMPVFDNKNEPDEDEYSLRCGALKAERVIIHTERELDVPSDRAILLRLMGQFANLFLYECKLEKHWPDVSVRHQTLVILSKVDFLLLERGIDMEELCDIVKLDYYNRERDIDLCGESDYLIEYYLDKLHESSSSSNGNEETPGKSIEEKYSELFKEARKRNVLTDGNQIVRYNVDFVRLCVEMKYFKPWGRPEFAPMDNYLKDRKGEPISANQLAQAYCDATTKTKKGV